MTPATFGIGQSIAVPDICKVPPFAVPAPFPNNGLNATVVPTYYTIMINTQPELNIGACYAVTLGDEAGAMGGVVSSTISGIGRPMLGSVVYFVGGMPSWRVTALTIQNMINAPGTTMVPSQTIKTVLS
ncbi:MAG: DUF4150 domain-containing protein [Aestuariivita sp.]|nr:DUF4150 domain-containing protein [Aestuariivita sp.]